MRNNLQIQEIKDTHSHAVQLHNIVPDWKIDFLKEHYENAADVRKVQKETGPKVLYVREGAEVIDDILMSLRTEFGNFRVRSAHFFEVEHPHVIHNDDDFDYPKAYKAFTIPIHTEGAKSDNAKLIMFNQYYYGGPRKFMNGGPVQKKNYYNSHLYEYTKVENKDNTGIPEKFKKFYLSHLKENWLQGLSVDRYFPWQIGSIIAFDSLQLHCASDFRQAGITKKLGLSIFTELEWN